MQCEINVKRTIGQIDPKIYGHFIEHFHRQIYDGVYDPTSPFADEDGFRSDVLEAMRNIKVPILRWPGGCFVSSYHWKKAIGKTRTPYFDKAWRVEDPNTFGTDEYIKLCRKLGCEPYICTNAGTGTAEEMSDWVEYCNLESEGEFAKWRVENGFPKPYQVKYWSIGNENYGDWEIGAKGADEWARLVEEAAKMMLHISPDLELSAAALTDPNWNFKLLQKAGHRLKWLSIHSYWDPLWGYYAPSDYATVISRTQVIGDSIDKIRGTLMMLGLEKRIKIAYDEWNLRSWHHPYSHSDITEGTTKEKYLYPRDKNDTNSTYTVADAVFSACFLNECIRNCDIVGMANFAPVVNTCGAIFTHEKGIVKRSTYYVFELMANLMGDRAVDCWVDDIPKETVNGVEVAMLDMVAAVRSSDGALTLSAVNKYDNQPITFTVPISSVTPSEATVYTVAGASVDSYNDIDQTQVGISVHQAAIGSQAITIELPPHSANVIVIR